MPVKIKEKPKKWELSHDDYLDLLETVDRNAKAILVLNNDMKKVKSRLGI
jgi:hypothetical protein|tara:strand:+ start:196 stop:345 length:150 start_codon:yes stop_codon:yes gene_type:complete